MVPIVHASHARFHSCNFGSCFVLRAPRPRRPTPKKFPSVRVLRGTGIGYLASQGTGLCGITKRTSNFQPSKHKFIHSGHFSPRGAYDELIMRFLSFLSSPRGGRRKVLDNDESLQMPGPSQEGFVDEGAMQPQPKLKRSPGRPRLEDNGSSLSSLYISEDGTADIVPGRSHFHAGMGAEFDFVDFGHLEWDEEQRNFSPRKSAIDSETAPNGADSKYEEGGGHDLEKVEDDADSKDEEGGAHDPEKVEDEIDSIDWGSFEFEHSVTNERSVQTSSYASEASIFFKTSCEVEKSKPPQHALGASTDSRMDPGFNTGRTHNKRIGNYPERKLQQEQQTSEISEKAPNDDNKSSFVGVLKVVGVTSHSYQNGIVSNDETVQTCNDVESSGILPLGKEPNPPRYESIRGGDFEQPSNSSCMFSLPRALGRRSSPFETGRDEAIDEQNDTSDAPDGQRARNRIPKKHYWRFRLDLLVIILVAVMILAIAIAIVSAFSLNDERPRVSAVTGPEKPPPKINPTSSPTMSLSPTSSCASPAIAIRTFIVELTIAVGVQDLLSNNEISEMIDTTKTWIDQVIRDVVSDCFAGIVVTSGVPIETTGADTMAVTTEYSTCLRLNDPSCSDEGTLWQYVRDSFSSGRRREARRLDSHSSSAFLDFLNETLSGNNPFRHSETVSIVATSPAPTSHPSSHQSLETPSPTISAILATITDSPTSAASRTTSSAALSETPSVSPQLASMEPSLSPLSPSPTNISPRGQTHSPSPQIPSIRAPTPAPSEEPSVSVSTSPSRKLSLSPSSDSVHPSGQPTALPTNLPSLAPSSSPSYSPSDMTSQEDAYCKNSPGCQALALKGHCCPTIGGVYLYCCNQTTPTQVSPQPSVSPQVASTKTPTQTPSFPSTSNPSHPESRPPTPFPARFPTALPTTVQPSRFPTPTPSARPTYPPTVLPSLPPLDGSSNAPSFSNASVVESGTHSPVTSVVPTNGPTATRFPSDSPTLPSPLRLLILDQAPASTALALADPDSAQSQALHHVILMNATTLTNSSSAVPHDWRWIQKFALLCYSFQTIQSGGLVQLPTTVSSQTWLSHHHRQLFSVTNWPNEGDNECEWIGVFCDFDGRIVAINVAQQGMPGQLVPEWVMLKDSLQLIDATNNDLTGTIPFEYGDLSMLHWLRLSRNRLTGNLPTSFVGLQSLTQLDLFRNQFSGEFPNVILSQMKGLLKLRIYSNNFNGTIDDNAVCNLGLSVLEADCYLLGSCVFPCW